MNGSNISLSPLWKKLLSGDSSGGYLTVCYSDPLSKYPVRWVTKPNDNKSDPNWETQTYGLFSHCNRLLRAGVVRKGIPYIFFCTKQNGHRALTGYYEIKYFCESNSGIQNDYGLLAGDSHFLGTPILLRDVDQHTSLKISRSAFRTKLLSGEECLKLRALIKSHPDSQDRYLDEIDRLERVNQFHFGFRYVGWRQIEKFSWELAVNYLASAKALASENIPTVLKSGDWACLNCNEVTKNIALLRRCPFCGEIGQLTPLSVKERKS